MGEEKWWGFRSMQMAKVVFLLVGSVGGVPLSLAVTGCDMSMLLS